MRQRVLERLAFEHVPRADIDLLDAALTPALATRCARLAEHDARLLHPARTVLILLDDARTSDATVLAAAALVDSEDPGLAPRDTALPGPVVELAAAVPVPHVLGERLLEELVTATRHARLIALAEWLDQARHAHMVAGLDPAAWLRRAHAVYLPVAARTEPLLARRFERWAGALARKLERS